MPLQGACQGTDGDRRASGGTRRRGLGSSADRRGFRVGPTLLGEPVEESPDIAGREARGEHVDTTRIGPLPLEDQIGAILLDAEVLQAGRVAEPADGPQAPLVAGDLEPVDGVACRSPP